MNHLPTASTALKLAEVISDGLLTAMVLKGLPSSHATFVTVVMQRETLMSFADFKVALRNHAENEKSHKDNIRNKDNVMATKSKFEGSCFKCGKKGQKSIDCWSKGDNSRLSGKCRSKTHDSKDCRSRKDASKTATEKF